MTNVVELMQPELPRIESLCKVVPINWNGARDQASAIHWLLDTGGATYRLTTPALIEGEYLSPAVPKERYRRTVQTLLDEARTYWLLPDGQRIERPTDAVKPRAMDSTNSREHSRPAEL